MFKHRVLLGAGVLAALGLWSGWAAQCRAQGTVPELRPVSGYTTSVDWSGSAILEFTYLDLILGKGLAPTEAATRR